MSLTSFKDMKVTNKSYSLFSQLYLSTKNKTRWKVNSSLFHASHKVLSTGGVNVNTIAVYGLTVLHESVAFNSISIHMGENKQTSKKVDGLIGFHPYELRT